MAIYAFDGTWNEDAVRDEVDKTDTNVVRFLKACGEEGVEKEYVEGVGTRFSLFGKIVGGAFGAGGRSRVREMYAQLQENFKNGDTDIDIIGFSRGAALALDFANKINDDGLKSKSGHHIDHPLIRFLGLWDTVGSFGLALDFISAVSKDRYRSFAHGSLQCGQMFSCDR